MTSIKQIISEGSEIAEELRLHLEDSGNPLRASWDGVSRWHDLALKYVEENSPADLKRIRPLDVLASSTDTYSGIEELLRILRGIRDA